MSGYARCQMGHIINKKPDQQKCGLVRRLVLKQK